MTQRETIIPVIMCGGAGTRLWPASREDAPKQFIRLFGETSTFQDTLTRVKDPELFERPIVVTSANFQDMVSGQATALGIDVELVLEPMRRDSGAAVAVAATVAAARHADANVIVLAADHAMPDVEGFRNACSTAMPAVTSGRIVTFGITPSEPSTSYGYLEPGEPLADGNVRALKRFVEKPDRATAQSYCDAGYLWNSGNFFFKAETMIAELERHAPEIKSAAENAVTGGNRDASGALMLDERAFAASPKISIDYAVMEKTDCAAVLPATFPWSDIGSWDAVLELSPRDVAGNASSGSTHITDTRNTLVHGMDDILTVVDGVDDLIVVTTKDAVMITTRDKAQNVKAVVEVLKDQGETRATRFSS